MVPRKLLGILHMENRQSSFMVVLKRTRQQKFLCITKKNILQRGQVNMEDSSTKEQNFILGLWGVRYQVKEVQRSIEFYTKILGFILDQQNLPAFGQVLWAISNLFSAVPGPRVLDRCSMAVSKSQVDGTGQFSKRRTCLLNSRRRECVSGSRPGRQTDPSGRPRWQPD